MHGNMMADWSTCELLFTVLATIIIFLDINCLFEMKFSVLFRFNELQYCRRLQQRYNNLVIAKWNSILTGAPTSDHFIIGN